MSDKCTKKVFAFQKSRTCTLIGTSLVGSGNTISCDEIFIKTKSRKVKMKNTIQKEYERITLTICLFSSKVSHYWILKEVFIILVQSLVASQGQISKVKEYRFISEVLYFVVSAKSTYIIMASLIKTFTYILLVPLRP